MQSSIGFLYIRSMATGFLRVEGLAKLIKISRSIWKASSNLKLVKLTLDNQQVCDCLLRGLDNTWKPIRDHLMYSPNEMSLENAIGALEAHKVSKQVSFDQASDNYAAPAVAQKNKQGCWTCGQIGHHSSARPNPPLKNKSKTKDNTTEAQAGKTLVAYLGNGGPSDEKDKEDNFDPEIDVVWG